MILSSYSWSQDFISDISNFSLEKPNNICEYNGRIDNISDRFLYGQMIGNNFLSSDIQRIYPGLYKISNLYAKNCGWGIFIKVKKDPFTQETIYTGSLIFRF